MNPGSRGDKAQSALDTESRDLATQLCIRDDVGRVICPIGDLHLHEETGSRVNVNWSGCRNLLKRSIKSRHEHWVTGPRLYRALLQLTKPLPRDAQQVGSLL